MEHCRGSLVREGGSLESYWCPAPQEFKSLPRRSAVFVKKNAAIAEYQMFQIRAYVMPISGNEMISQIRVLT
jgi:hypothetical protein